MAVVGRGWGKVVGGCTTQRNPAVCASLALRLEGRPTRCITLPGCLAPELPLGRPWLSRCRGGCCCASLPPSPLQVLPSPPLVFMLPLLPLLNLRAWSHASSATASSQPSTSSCRAWPAAPAACASTPPAYTSACVGRVRGKGVGRQGAKGPLRLAQGAKQVPY